MNKVDIIILIIIFIFAILGYYKGLVKSVLNLFKFFVTIVLALYMAPFFSNILIEKLNLKMFILQWIKNNSESISSAINFVNEEILQSIVGRIINTISLIILFVIINMMLTIIIGILNKIANLPIINIVNKFGGLGFGAIKGTLVVYILVIILKWLPFENLNEIKKELDLSISGQVVNTFVPDIVSEMAGYVKAMKKE